MNDVFSYLSEHGHEDFTRLKFTEADTVVFSAISYIRFERIFKKKDLTIKEIVNKFLTFSRARMQEYVMYPIDEKFIRRLARCKRFTSLHIIDYKKCISRKTCTQFFAITIKLDENNLLVAYRGTDESLIGWKESIRLGFIKDVEGQVYAKEYLENTILNNPNMKIYVLGHSKGGNLAMYAASKIDFKLSYNIKNVFNMDGPCLLDSVKKESNYDKIQNKINIYIPKASIIGIIIGSDKRCKLIESAGLGILQHVYYFWVIKGTKFKLAKRRTVFSKSFEKTFTAWFKNITYKEACEYVELLFKWIKKADINTIDDFGNVIKLAKLINCISEEKSIRKDEFGEKLQELLNMYISDCIRQIVKKK